MPSKIRVEFHCHTHHSADSLARAEDLLAACRKRGIDRLVITDHNTIAGALEAQALDPGRVIVGEEVMTLEGELLAAFVAEQVPEGLTPEEAIARLRAQGAFVSVSHPFDSFRSGGWRPQALERIAPLVDAIETFNARCYLPRFNRRAQAFARQHGLPGTAGSDAHTSFEIGRATMRLPSFEDAEGLRRALPQVEYDLSRSSPLVHAASRYAKWRKALDRRLERT